LASLQPDVAASRVAAHEALNDWMESRLDLGGVATPLQPAVRLSAALGREVWFKRDDLTAFALGGNKVRKMELIATVARRSGADAMITIGGSQSNHVRTVAATASVLGMACHAILSGDRPRTLTGNILLDELFGAQLHFAQTDDWLELSRIAESVADGLRTAGTRPVLIPVGGATAEGSLAFAAAYLEFNRQCSDLNLSPRSIVHASSSGGTQAGLEVGRWLSASEVEVVGIDVAAMDNDLQARVRRLARDAARLIGIDNLEVIPAVADGYLGPGYALPSEGGTHAQLLVARTEGIVLDHVYTAKAMHGLIDQTELEGPLVFWHTGGSPAVFSNQVPG